MLCTGGAHKPGGDGVSPLKMGAAAGGADHTVIPFAVAIRRMSEILAYKAKECRSKVSHQSAFNYFTALICNRPHSTSTYSCECVMRDVNASNSISYD